MTAPDSPRDLVRRLAARTEDICRHYLSNGVRSGRYWLVGDVRNTPGRSLYVRLHGDGAGRWCDAATGEHGDLLDLIRHARDLPTFPETLAEARRALALPAPDPADAPVPRRSLAGASSPACARRLFRAGVPIDGTPAAAYLAARGLDRLDAEDRRTLRFHPAVLFRETSDAPGRRLPALLGAITDPDGHITGVSRCWLDPARAAKADLPAPRRILGALRGHGVRFGRPAGLLVAGEGIETVRSVTAALPGLPAVAALTAINLTRLILPDGLERLCIARDNDAAGLWAAATLRTRAEDAGIAVTDLAPVANDFNDDLRILGPAALARRLRDQLDR